MVSEYSVAPLAQGLPFDIQFQLQFLDPSVPAFRFNVQEFQIFAIASCSSFNDERFAIDSTKVGPFRDRIHRALRSEQFELTIHHLIM